MLIPIAMAFVLGAVILTVFTAPLPGDPNPQPQYIPLALSIAMLIISSFMVGFIAWSS